MSKVKGFPGNQSFNVSPKRNLTKKNAWWQIGKSNNPRQQHQKKEDQAIKAFWFSVTHSGPGTDDMAGKTASTLKHVVRQHICCALAGHII